MPSDLVPAFLTAQEGSLTGDTLCSIFLPGYCVFDLLDAKQKAKIIAYWALNLSIPVGTFRLLKGIQRTSSLYFYSLFSGAASNWLFGINQIRCNLEKKITLRSFQSLRRYLVAFEIESPRSSEENKVTIGDDLLQGVSCIELDLKTIFRLNYATFFTGASAALSMRDTGNPGPFIHAFVAKIISRLLSGNNNDSQQDQEREEHRQQLRYPIWSHDHLGNRQEYHVEGTIRYRREERPEIGAAAQLVATEESNAIWNTFDAGSDIFRATNRIKQVRQFIAFVDNLFPISARMPDGYFNMQPIISVRNLGYRKNKNDPFLYRNQTFSMGAGIVRLTGSNGSGKSTLFKLATGSLRPTEGEIQVCGVNIHTLSFEQLDQVITYAHQNVIFQRMKPVIYNILWRCGPFLASNKLLFALNKIIIKPTPKSREAVVPLHRQIRQFISSNNADFGGERLNQTLQEMDDIADRLNVRELLNKDTSRLSGGQAKLIMMIVVVIRLRLMPGMKVVLLDEIEEGIDAARIQTLKSFFRDGFPGFKQVTTLLASHDTRLFSAPNPVRTDAVYHIEGNSIEEMNQGHSALL